MAGKAKKSLLGQFYRRKVMRVALGYFVVGWIMMQIGEVTFEALSLPPWALTFLIIIVVLGLPIALVLAWAFEVTPEGIIKDPADETPALASSAHHHESPSVAVLPFDDMTEQGDHGYFCEGIAEEILNSLCQVKGLKVASRVASFRFGGKQADILEIGRKLHVGAVLEGSVRQFGEDLRITAQLIDSSDGFHFWTRQYNRKRDDMFGIQEDIAQRIVDAFNLTMKQKEQKEKHNADPLAYDYLLRGRYYFTRCNRQNSIFARQMFRKAVETDPDYGHAWAWLAYAYAFEYMYFDASHKNRVEAARNSKKALIIAPELAESHIAAGICKCIHNECSTAAKSFEKAIKLNPGKFEAWYFYGRSRIREGKPLAALKLLQEAARVQPEDFQCLLLQAQLYVSLGDQNSALEVSKAGIERARTVLEFCPDDNRAKNLGALALQRIGETQEAATWMQDSLRTAPYDPIVLYNAACFYSLRGDIDNSLKCLERSFHKVGAVNPQWLENDSDLENIRHNPRFKNIVSKMPLIPTKELYDIHI